jgi:hypothetical protein
MVSKIKIRVGRSVNNVEFPWLIEFDMFGESTGLGSVN